MASIDEGGGDSHKKGPGVKKAKKLSTRVDMTPMVDLGFLLITFFIFTTTMSSPTTMDLFMPKDTDKDEEQNKAKETGALTLLLGKDNNIYYYEGQLKPDASNFLTSNFSKIRQVIIDKKKAVIAAHVHDVVKRYRKKQGWEILKMVLSPTLTGKKHVWTRILLWLSNQMMMLHIRIL
jgi:biopolymer transport protein ExbD